MQSTRVRLKKVPPDESIRKPWWLTTRKITDRYIRDAKALIATGDATGALVKIESSLALSPRSESALEIKAKCLLYLRRYKDVADMLQDYIPSVKAEYSGNSSLPLVKDRVKPLPAACSDDDRALLNCFPVFDLKRKVLAGIFKKSEQERPWRYLVLGHACYHLGLMEDAMILIQSAKRLSSAALRRESNSWSHDSYFMTFPAELNSLAPRMPTEFESTTQLLPHIKQLLCRKSAGIAAMDAGIYAEAVRHFSKIVDSRHGGSQGFLSECYMLRAIAYKSAGRIAEAVSDCNRTLALDPSSMQALITRASLLETIRCLPDCLHDLEHLKLLYNSVMRDGKLPGPAWKRYNVRFTEIPEKLGDLSKKMEELKHGIANEESSNADYYALMGLKRGCSRSELEKANLIISLKHKPESVTSFIDKCKFTDGSDVDTVKERARISGLLLHRLLQKGYMQILGDIVMAEEQRKVARAALEATALQIQEQKKIKEAAKLELKEIEEVFSENDKATWPSPGNKCSPYRASLCRDIDVVRSLLSRVGFNHPVPVKYEALRPCISPLVQ